MVAPPSRDRAPSRWERWAVGVVGRGQVAGARRVIDRYVAAGGALLAGGLAYSALFAIIPALLLSLGLSGALLGAEADRSLIVAVAGRVAPPLAPLLAPLVDELARLSGSLSLIGLVGLTWGASRFAVALDSALGLVFGDPARRGLIGRQLLGLTSVAAMVAAVVVGTVLAGWASLLEAAVLAGGVSIEPALGALLALAGPTVAVGSLALVYRFLPVRRPTWRAAVVPALVVGVGVAVGTRLFIALAPRLIGATAVLGTLATAFIALAWFGATFQALLIGAAWVRERERTAPVV